MKNTQEIPRVFLARQRFQRPRVDNLEAAVKGELARIFPAGSLQPGARIGITVGSRGIANIAALARAAVDFFKSREARPFIIPAMGSHGGATAEGQRALIAHYGVTEEAMGCPVRAEMKTRSLGRTARGVEAFLAETALEADGVLLMNRVKPHTDYKGPIESGLTKICGIGLGKLEGASEYHSHLHDLGLGVAIRSAVEKILETGKILGGLAILENAYHETARIAGVPAARMLEEEERLLKEAYQLMGRLPFQEFDLLVCDQMGKNISGAGLDTNIIGRCVYGFVQGKPWIEGMPSIARIFVRTLTDESDGNAVGMGLFEFATPRFMAKVNHQVTQLNAFTACSPLGAKPPIVLPNDREAIAVALKTSKRRPDGPRLAYIRDTLSLEEVYLSEAFLSEAGQRRDLKVMGDPRPLEFDAEGWLVSPFVGKN
ncbi:MAG: [Fe-S]-binding protein [Planctomycetes bacterium]|nr:[Fe-S]-binding protein [Planctomycetota bacterium]